MKAWLVLHWRRASLFAALLLVTAVVGRYWLFLQRLKAPLQLQNSYVLTVGIGSNFTRILRQIQKDGVINNDDLLYYVRFNHLATQIKAGEYELVAGMTALGLVQLLQEGKVIEYQARIGEGWTLREAIEALHSQPALKPVVNADDVHALQAAFATDHYPEGMVFPETYNFVRNTTDMEILQRAKMLMDRMLQAAWAERDEGLPYQSPYEVLIMASIIEKETGMTVEQPQIAGVFVRRLQQHMKLQTDPTVIYGVGPGFDGNLTRAHLQTDTPFNTYTREGLPPTPIALPSRNAILASVHPAAGTALYFVAKGDGTHYFSATLAEHNAAVRQYQLGKKP